MPGLDRPQPTAAVVCCDEVTDDVTNDVIDDLEAGIETKGGPSIWHLMPTYFNKSSKFTIKRNKNKNNHYLSSAKP